MHDFSLDIRAGELLALLGPSGSGKTTLLRLIAGLERPDAGRILFGDQDTTDLPVQRRAVGFVFQHYALFRHMTVANNIAYGLQARRRAERPGTAEIKRRVDDLLDLIRLSGFGDRYPSQLSGGQRQRVALARALAIEPRVLLLDEPFGALDAQVRTDLRHWLREVHNRTGQTTVFVTHDQDEALELADRVAILSDGQLEQVGSPDEVQDKPLSPTVVRFLGDASTIAATVDNGVVYVGGRATVVRPPPGMHGPIQLYVRPWHFGLVAPGAGHLTGKVQSDYRVGGRRRLLVTGDSRKPLIVECSASSTLRSGDDVSLSVEGGFPYSVDNKP